MMILLVTWLGLLAISCINSPLRKDHQKYHQQFLMECGKRVLDGEGRGLSPCLNRAKEKGELK